MLVHFSLGAVLVLFNFFASFYGKSSKIKVFSFAFILIFFYSAFRYDYGGDYFGYDDIHSDIINDFERKNMELGFSFLLSLFPSYYIFIIFQSFLYAVVMFYFFYNNILPKYFSFAILMIFITPSLLLDTFGAIRSSLVALIFLFSLRFVYSKILVHYLLFVSIASLIHLSAIFLFFIYFIVHSDLFSNKKLVMFVLTLLLFFGSQFKNLFINSVLDYSVFFRYIFYETELLRETGFYNLILLSPFLLIGYFIINSKSEASKLNLIYNQIAIIYIIIIFLRVDVLGRFAMYFWPVLLVAVINATLDRKKYIKYIVFAYLIFYSIFNLIVFYSIPGNFSLLKYKLIFFN
jgi:hypothetical protein